MTQRAIPKNLKKRNDELNQITIESVTQAFLLLLDTKEYDKITITDICEKAGVSRNAFYNNFQTKENVFKRIVLDFNKDAIFRKFGSPFNRKATVEWYINFFRTVQEYEKLFTLIIRYDFQNIYLNYVNDLLMDSESTDPKTKYVRLMWNGAIQNMTTEWIKNGMQESIEEMGQLCYQRLSPIVEKSNISAHLFTWLRKM